MRVTEITFQTIGNAFRHQAKLIVLFVLAFTLLGTGTGLFYAPKLSAPAGGTAQPLESVDPSMLTYNIDYLFTCEENLQKSYEFTQTYLQTLSTNSSINKIQKQQLKKVEEKLLAFKQKTLDPIKVAFDAPNALYIPEEFIDHLIAVTENNLKKNSSKLKNAQEAARLLETIETPRIAQENLVSVYTSLLSNAAQIGELQTDIAKNETRLEILKNHSEQFVEDSQAMEQEMDKAAQKLTVLGTELYQVANEIAQENALTVELKTGDDGTTQVTVNHSYTATSTQDVFAILLIFCVLVGLCSGAFFAICRESRGTKGKHDQ